MENKKSKFGLKLDQTNKWEIYKNKPVSVNFSGANYCGVVKKIDAFKNCVYIQPFVMTNSLGTRVDVVDKPAMVPFDGSVVAPIKQDTLENFVKDWNKAKQEEMLSKRLGRAGFIVLPGEVGFRH